MEKRLKSIILIVVITSPNMHISNHHIAHFTNIQFYLLITPQ